MSRIAAWCITLCFATSLAFAEPINVKTASPLDTLETLQGAVELSRTRQNLTVSVRGLDPAADRLFNIETTSLTGIPASFRTASAEVLYWGGHLIVVAPREGKALHFSIPGFDELPRATKEPRSTPIASQLNTVLREKYQLIQIDAAAIISRGGPRAFQPEQEETVKKILGREADNQDPGSGVGSCGTSCNINCADGSSCSANCSTRRCASCSCPASCLCK